MYSSVSQRNGTGPFTPHEIAKVIEVAQRDFDMRQELNGRRSCEIRFKDGSRCPLHSTEWTADPSSTKCLLCTLLASKH